MRRADKRGDTIEREAEACPDCKEGIKPGQKHCRGSQVSFYRAPVYELRREGNQLAKIVPEYHHGAPWGPCWKCGGDMGCSLCVPGDRKTGRCFELYCRRCRVAANLDTLLEFGPPAGFCLEVSGRTLAWKDRSNEFPKLQAYPAAWVSAYVAQCIRLGVEYEGDGRAEFLAVRKQFERLIGGERMPSAPSHRKLAQIKHEQDHEALTGARKD